jgi:peroxiredoxin
VIEAGAKAPDFTLPDQTGSDVSLSDFAGRNLVIVFYPADFSPGCTDQLSIYQEVLDEIRAKAEIVGISVDSSWTHRALAKSLGIEFTLLADFHPKGEVAKGFGVYNEERGQAKRSLFLLDGEGVVRWAHEAQHPEIPGANLIFDALAETAAV